MKFKDFLLGLSEEVTSGDIQTAPTKLGMNNLKGDFHEDDHLEDTEDEASDNIEDQLVQITQEIFNQSVQDIHTYCKRLQDEYFDYEYDQIEFQGGVNQQYNTKEDLIYIILMALEDGIDEEEILDVMGTPDVEFQGSDEDDYYDLVLSYLNTLFPDELTERVTEGVTGRFTVKNYNRKKRKFMQKSKSVMNRTKTKRRQDQRQNRAARRQYYRKNKMKIKRYQKQRNKAIQQGKHKVKIRRRA